MGSILVGALAFGVQDLKGSFTYRMYASAQSGNPIPIVRPPKTRNKKWSRSHVPGPS